LLGIKNINFREIDNRKEKKFILAVGVAKQTNQAFADKDQALIASKKL
jgi:hypothetical protein